MDGPLTGFSGVKLGYLRGAVCSTEECNHAESGVYNVRGWGWKNNVSCWAEVGGSTFWA